MSLPTDLYMPHHEYALGGQSTIIANDKTNSHGTSYKLID